MVILGPSYKNEFCFILEYFTLLFAFRIFSSCCGLPTYRHRCTIKARCCRTGGICKHDVKFLLFTDQFNNFKISYSVLSSQSFLIKKHCTLSVAQQNRWTNQLQQWCIVASASDQNIHYYSANYIPHIGYLF